MITDAYTGHQYYSNGAWDIPDQAYYNTVVQPPVSGIRFPIKREQRITSRFGFRSEYNRMHFGMDISMNAGDTVKCYMPGTVSKANYDKGYGNYLVIVHDNGLETRYAHLQKILVSPGQRVNEQEGMALSGTSGNSTGPHLHIETRFRGIPIDPESVFDFIISD
ncbi:MAG: M23 family metallopeptidase [Muribaculaceae bacterium]|nr:M23 family metallopeptidase [Muribaculaceae bacterium]